MKLRKRFEKIFEERIEVATLKNKNFGIRNINKIILKENLAPKQHRTKTISMYCEHS